MRRGEVKREIKEKEKEDNDPVYYFVALLFLFNLVLSSRKKRIRLW